MTVEVTDSGDLQLNRDGVLFAPLSIDDVNALAARIPDAAAAAGRTTLTRIMRDLITLLSAVPGLAATVVIAGDAADVTVDGATAGAIEALWGATPDPVTGFIVNGPVTVHTTLSTVSTTRATTWAVLP